MWSIPLAGAAQSPSTGNQLLEAPQLGGSLLCDLKTVVSPRRIKTSPDLKTLLKGGVSLCCSLDASGMECRVGEAI